MFASRIPNKLESFECVELRWSMLSTPDTLCVCVCDLLRRIVLCWTKCQKSCFSLILLSFCCWCVVGLLSIVSSDTKRVWNSSYATVLVTLFVLLWQCTSLAGQTERRFLWMIFFIKMRLAPRPLDCVGSGKLPATHYTRSCVTLDGMFAMEMRATTVHGLHFTRNQWIWNMLTNVLSYNSRSNVEFDIWRRNFELQEGHNADPSKESTYYKKSMQKQVTIGYRDTRLILNVTRICLRYRRNKNIYQEKLPPDMTQYSVMDTEIFSVIFGMPLICVSNCPDKR